MRKMIKLVMVFIVILALFCGCSGANYDKSPDVESAEYDAGEQSYEAADRNSEKLGIAGTQAFEEQEEDASGPEAADGTAADDKPDTNDPAADPTAGTDTEVKKETKEEKLVYTCNLTIETTEYKKTMEEIEKTIRDYSGIIESQNEYDNDSGWYIDGHTKTSGTMECTIVVKVPSGQYQSFLKALDGKGKMTAKSMNVTNISRSYYDTKATIESLKIQEKRLLKMMDEAKTIDEMISVERRLTEVQTQLNQYNTRLSVMDTEVAYSTVTMTVREVLEYKESEPGKKTNTFTERLRNTLEESVSGFLSFMEGLLFLIIRLFPFIVVFGILWFVLKPVRIRFKAYHQARKEARKLRKEYKKAQKMEKKEDKKADDE